jgi:tetratricopeptide (TPR) repeat protein
LYAALTSEKLGDISVAREFYNSAIRRFGNQPAFDSQVKMQLLEFLLRTKEYASAAVLSEELTGAPGVDEEKLSLRRLIALKKLKRYAEAAEIAETLSRSPVPFRAAEGMWEVARLTELQEKFREARQLYLRFIERFPNEARVPEAMLSAADFALQQQDFAAAGRELEEFLQKFSRHEAVQKVLLGAVFSLIQQKDKSAFQRAEKLFERMKKEFSGTAEYDQALLEVARCYQAENNYTQALKLLEEFLKERPRSTLFNEALYLSAEIFEKIGNYSKAIEYVDRILDKTPNSHPGVDAVMLGGRCSFRSGDYRKALKYYERAGELGGRGVIALVAAGEAADCHVLLRQTENLKTAAGIYRKLADQTDFPALQAQALYKLGAVYEQMQDNLNALQAYEELLSLAVASPKVRQSSGAAAWCARSARNALRIVLAMPHLPDGSQRAQRIYYLYALLNLPGSADELRSYLAEIRKHYNLLD